MEHVASHTIMSRHQHRMPVLAFDRDGKEAADDIEVLVLRQDIVVRPPARVLVARRAARVRRRLQRLPELRVLAVRLVCSSK